MSGYMQLEMTLFLKSAALGAVLLVCYDILRIFRRLFLHSVFAVGAEDILYWVVAGFLVFARIYQTNQGILRGFLFLGIGLGMLLYRTLLGDFFVNLCSKILGIPIIFVKKTRNMLLFWIRRCRIYVCGFARRKKVQNIAFRRLRGSRVEKSKKKIRTHQNSE